MGILRKAALGSLIIGLGASLARRNEAKPAPKIRKRAARTVAKKR